MNSTVPTVESFRFLGTTISQDLKWDTHIDSIIKKAQQRLYFLRQLRKFNLPQELLTHFYSAVIESVLCTSITVWFGSATKSDIRRLQRTVRTAEPEEGLLVLLYPPFKNCIHPERTCKPKRGKARSPPPGISRAQSQAVAVADWYLLCSRFPPWLRRTERRPQTQNVFDIVPVFFPLPVLVISQFPPL
ncbi:hypothetical protein QTP86_010796 [Hemibagrus guttatus]|nr:hypothetical protein QTP86_010796 [Hemibagrus guttatus]